MAEILKNGIYVSFDNKIKGTDMPTFHYHDFYEIYYLYSGFRRYVVNNKIYDLKAGDIMIVDKNEFHITKNLNKNSEYKRYLLYITGDALRSLGDNSAAFERFFKNRVISLGEDSIKRVSHIFKGLLENYDTSDMFSRQLLVNGVYELCTVIYGALKNENSGKDKIFFHNNIDKALLYLYDNFKEPVSLEDTAGICNMNKSYFSRYFKRVTGIGFCRYLNALRIKEAARLLENTDMTVSEVADASGFESLQHFCAAFKGAMGVSALKYREQSKNKGL